MLRESPRWTGRQQQPLYALLCYLVGRELRQQGAVIPFPLSVKLLNRRLHRFPFPFSVLGILILCRDERTRIDCYLRTVNRYLDFKPVLRRHERV